MAIGTHVIPGDLAAIVDAHRPSRAYGGRGDVKRDVLGNNVGRPDETVVSRIIIPGHLTAVIDAMGKCSVGGWDVKIGVRQAVGASHETVGNAIGIIVIPGYLAFVVDAKDVGSIIKIY
jgi:hypothetical protein